MTAGTTPGHNTQPQHLATTNGLGQLSLFPGSGGFILCFFLDSFLSYREVSSLGPDRNQQERRENFFRIHLFAECAERILKMLP